jgi:hypothetical protein
MSVSAAHVEKNEPEASISHSIAPVVYYLPTVLQFPAARALCQLIRPVHVPRARKKEKEKEN